MAKELLGKHSWGQVLALLLGAAAGRGVFSPGLSLPASPSSRDSLYLPDWGPAVKGRARDASAA